MFIRYSIPLVVLIIALCAHAQGALIHTHSQSGIADSFFLPDGVTESDILNSEISGWIIAGDGFTDSVNTLIGPFSVSDWGTERSLLTSSPADFTTLAGVLTDGLNFSLLFGHQLVALGSGAATGDLESIIFSPVGGSPDLSGYTITDVTMTLQNVNYTHFFSDFFQQELYEISYDLDVNFYGEKAAVPDTTATFSSLCFSLLGLLALSRKRKRQ